MKKIVIWGSGGHAREVNFLCERLSIDVLGFLDERPLMRGTFVHDLPVIGDLDGLSSFLEEFSISADEIGIVCAGVGDPRLKERFATKTIQAGFKIAPPLIHPNVYVSPRNSIGLGAIICDGTTLTVDISIGNFVIINRAVTIGHDANIKDYATISPGANISGNVTVGEGCFIGTGSSIREKVDIGSWSVIGGGAFVTTTVPNNVLYAGVPAALKKHLS